MDTAPRILGPLGEVGPLAFGHWRFTGHDVGAARELVETALELGMNLIDTADIYGYRQGGEGFGDSERLLGSVLAVAPELRERMVLATKGGIDPGSPYDSSRKYLEAACDASLGRLGVETIDLYQVHRPDLFAHPEEVAAALDHLHRIGKVRAVGVSNHTASMIETLRPMVSAPFVSTQPEFSIARLDPMRNGEFDQAIRMNLVPLAWSPLAGGRLATGEGMRTDLMRAIDRVAAREEVDRAAVALAFVLSHPSRPVAIVGTQRPARLREAVRALDVRLERKDLYALVEASEGVPLP